MIIDGEGNEIFGTPKGPPTAGVSFRAEINILGGQDPTKRSWSNIAKNPATQMLGLGRDPAGAQTIGDTRSGHRCSGT